jgi:hypothetical protein
MCSTTSGACAAGRCSPSLWADRQSDDVAAKGCSDRSKLLGRAVADGLDTLLESPGVKMATMRPGSPEILRQLWGTPLDRVMLAQAYASKILSPIRDAVATPDDTNALPRCDEDASARHNRELRRIESEM